MRHASGQLYQEAHLALERQPMQQSLFPGAITTDQLVAAVAKAGYGAKIAG